MRQFVHNSVSRSVANRNPSATRSQIHKPSMSSSFDYLDGTEQSATKNLNVARTYAHAYDSNNIRVMGEKQRNNEFSPKSTEPMIEARDINMSKFRLGINHTHGNS